MVGRSNNEHLVNFWNEIIEDISFWSMISEENKEFTEKKVKEAFVSGIMNGFKEAYENIDDMALSSQRILELQRYLVEKKPENWKVMLYFLMGLKSKEELWQD